MEWRGYHLFWTGLLCAVGSTRCQLLSAQEAGSTSSEFGYSEESRVQLCSAASAPEVEACHLLSLATIGKSGRIGALKIIFALNIS